MSTTSILELAIYKIKSESAAQFPETQAVLEKGLEKHFPGFISFKTTKSLDDPLVCLDYVEWDSIENAKIAAEKIKTMQEFSPLFLAIDEVLYYGHLNNLSA